MDLCDVPRQQIGDAVYGMICDAGEDVSQIELRVESVELGGSDERVEGGGAFTSPVRASEEIIFFDLMRRPARRVRRRCCRSRPLHRRDTE